MKIKCGLIILLLFWGTFSFAQNILFKQGDRVAFVGNSITNNGEFHHNILLYYLTRFPNQRVDFFNCGISGDQTGGILNRMDDDILIHKPTHVVLMIGMNDVNRSLYGSRLTTDADTLQKREAALNKYRTKLDSIVRIFLLKNVKVILQTPTIYDQTALLKTPNNLGVNDALKKCAAFGQTLADKYKLPIVDYWTILNSINVDLQEKDPSATIIGADRVHPAAAGHLIMAYQFLKTMDMPNQVAEINVQKNAERSNRASGNCTLSDFRKQSHGLQFRVKEDALPFPLVENQRQGLQWVPFQQTLNLELLKIQSLAAGTYQLTIDDDTIGTFSHFELTKGINLSLFEHSPQYRQALQVRAILTELWKAEADLRTLKFVEYGFLKTFEEKDNLEAVKKYLDHTFTTRLSNNNYFKTQFDKYILAKPNEQQLIQRSDELRQKAYQTAQPQPHTFNLKFL